jgi:hypothetical protein
MRLQKSPTEPNKEPHLIRLMGDACQGVLGPLGALDVRLLRAVRTQLPAREHSASASRYVEAGVQIRSIWRATISRRGASETT